MRPHGRSLHGPAAAVNTFMHGKAAADDDATPDLESRVGDEPGVRVAIHSRPLVPHKTSRVYSKMFYGTMSLVVNP